MIKDRIKNNNRSNAIVGGDAHVDPKENKSNANAVGAGLVPAQRGITLIALIITIIILLILAGVTINVLIGDNGLFNTAKNAGESYKIAGIRETVEAEILALDIEKTSKGETLTIEQALTELNKKGTFGEISIEENIGIKDGYVITLGYNENGKVVIKEIEKDVGIRIALQQEPKGYTNGTVEILVGVSGGKEKITNIEVPTGMTKIAEGKYKIEKNGSYNIKVTLTNGEKLEKEIIVNVIDKISPKEFTPQVTINEGKIEIKENGEDSEATSESVKSGIDYYEYYVINSSNEETKYTTNEIIGLPAGIYRIYLIAYDKAGNHTKSEEVEIELVTEWIYSEAQLRNMAKDLTKDYKLMQDIVLTKNWTPIGDNSTNQFNGTLEGNGHKISGLKIENIDGQYQGLFGFIGKEGKISNLKLEGTATVGGTTALGLLTGCNWGTIENVKVKGTVTGNENIGGLVGLNVDGTIEGCYSEVEANGNFCGGLVGDNCRGTISKCSSSAIIGNGKFIGGLVGYNDASSTIENSYSKGSVSGTSYVGGLVGRNEATVKKSYSRVAVSGSSDIGGLIGKNEEGATVENSYWCEDLAGVETSAGGTELTLEQMKTQSSYEGFDFTGASPIWVMKEYPELVF